MFFESGYNNDLNNPNCPFLLSFQKTRHHPQLTATTHTARSLATIFRNYMTDYMIQRVLLIISLILLSSCATLLKRKNCDILISSNVEHAQIQVMDSLYNLPAKVSVKRSKKDLSIKLISDTSKKDFIIKSSLNPTFVFANLLWAEYCPIAYLIDLTNQKRFYYGKSIFLDKYDTTKLIAPLILKNFHRFSSKTYPTYKDQIFLTVSIPWINNFYLQPNRESVKSNTGFWGFSFGVDYFYSDTKFLNISFSEAADFFVPIPAAVDIYGDYELMNSIYASLTQNFKMTRFSLGYGINISGNSWNLKAKNSMQSEGGITESLGITTNMYYQLGKHFFTGIIYRPSVLRVYPKVDFKYEHLISIDFGWKIKLK